MRDLRWGSKSHILYILCLLISVITNSIDNPYILINSEKAISFLKLILSQSK